VLQWGSTRAQLLGIEAVLGNGRVVSHLTGLAKDNTGYDLAGLLCGSEGTLGVVTAASLRLRPVPRAVAVAMVGVRATRALVDLLVRWRGSLTGLHAMEFLVGPVASIVADELGVRPAFPRPWPVHVLVEVAGDDPMTAVTDALGHDGAVADSAVAHDATGRARLWSHRDRVPEALRRRGDVHKFDVSVPVDGLVSYLGEVETVVRSVDRRLDTWLFGHLGDGNVHVNVTGPGGLLREPAVAERLDDTVLRCTVDHGGSISAEHGIGRAKRRWLHLVRSDAELDTFRRIKSALDPDGIMNPGVLLTPTVPDVRAPHAARSADPS
jgi:FAD/FMN-containing dehydrogenase